jgi:hypothetical protein
MPRVSLHDTERAALDLLGRRSAVTWAHASQALRAAVRAPKRPTSSTRSARTSPAITVSVDHPGGLAALSALLDGASERETLIVAFTNSASATAVAESLEGRSLPLGAMADQEVQRLFAAKGFRVSRRAAGPWEASSELATDTRRALLALAGQVSRTGADGWVAYELTRGEVAAPKAFEPGLLSVVMRNHSLSRLHLIDHAVFSLACQEHQPLELVIVTQATEPGAIAQLQALVARHQPLSGFRVQVLQAPSKVDIRGRLINLGVAAAHGQYIAFLDDDDVVYPGHYTRLISAIEASGRAWAFGRVRRAYLTQAPDGELYCRKKDFFPLSERLELARLVHDNYITCHSYVIDRSRLGDFPVAFEESLTKGEDYVFLLRLLALFKPVALGNLPGCEYRIRDDGSNTIVHESKVAGLREQLLAEWGVAIAKKNALKAPLQLLLTEGELDADVARYLPASEPTGKERPEALRYRIVDALNDAIKGGLPGVHSRVRSIFFRGEE